LSYNNEPEFIVGDATNLEFIEDESVDLIITSPPYLFVNPERYGGKAEKQINYLADEEVMTQRLLAAFNEMDRVLKNNKVIAINIGDARYEDNSYRMFPEKFILNILNEGKYKLLREIIIKDEITQLFDTNTNYFKWFILCKGQPIINDYYFQRYKGNLWLTDTELPHPEILQSNRGVLDTFSTSFAERIIRIYSRPGDIVLDPFGGLGTTAIAAYENNRKCISIDISIEQKFLAKQNFEIYNRELVKQ
jgi:DNA modification methylase